MLHRSVFVLVLVCHVAKLYPIRNLLISIMLAIYQSKFLLEKTGTNYGESTVICFACDVKRYKFSFLRKINQKVTI